MRIVLPGISTIRFDDLQVVVMKLLVVNLQRLLVQSYRVCFCRNNGIGMVVLGVVWLLLPIHHFGDRVLVDCFHTAKNKRNGFYFSKAKGIGYHTQVLRKIRNIFWMNPGAQKFLHLKKN